VREGWLDCLRPRITFHLGQIEARNRAHFAFNGKTQHFFSPVLESYLGSHQSITRAHPFGEGVRSSNETKEGKKRGSLQNLPNKDCRNLWTEGRWDNLLPGAQRQ